MQFFKKRAVQCLLLILIGLVFYSVCEFCLLKPEGAAYATMHDLAKEKDLDVVVIGNSEASCHFNPYLFQEMTGKNAFNLSRTSSIVITQYVLMEEMFQNHKPEKVIVFFDPFTLQRMEESSFVQATVWPYLSNPLRRMEYALTLAAEDNAYIDRFFPWRLYMAGTPGDLVYNIKNKLSIMLGNDSYYDYVYSLLNQETNFYLGKGFSPKYADRATTMERVNKNCQCRYEKKEYLMHEDVKEWIRKMNELCRKNNCEMIAVNVPRLPAMAIAHMLNIYDAQEQFFVGIGVPYWNFCYAKEHVMPQLDASYYSDQSHLSWAGADILTESLARVFNAYENGDDISDMFYTTEEYLDSIDFVTNTWLTEKEKGGQTTFIAHANHGTNVVPEYRFAKVDTNGCETVLQDYSTESVCLAKLNEGEKLRLYTRNASNLEQQPLNCEFE